VLLGENTLHVNYQAFENDDLIKMPGRNAEMVVVGVALSVIVWHTSTTAKRENCGV
jgi:hypothetical protein